MAQNPFYHRGPIREASDFFGREAETEQVTSLLRVSQSVSIVGPRRIGKTSFLYHLLSPDVRARYGVAGPEYLFASLSAEGLTRASLSEVYSVLLDALRDALEHPEPLTTTPADYRTLDGALKTLCGRGIKVAFLMDEFEALAGNPSLDPSFFSGLRGLATRYAVSFVIASQRPLIALVYADDSVLSSPFFNIFATVPLGLFDAEEARRMVLQFLTVARFELPAQALTDIAAEAGPFPFFAQLAAYHAMELARTAPGWDERMSATLSDAFFQEAQPHLLYAWHNLSDTERHTLANLAVVQADGAARESLRQLEDQCLLIRADEGYSYLSAAVRRFVRCQHVPGLLQVDPFVVDLRRRVATAGETTLDLTRTQLDLLAYLARREGQVATNRELEESVWHDEYVDDPERIKAAIKHLRRALGSYGACIVNERGVGYALRPIHARAPVARACRS